jgi:MoxR-like ATPase
MSWPIFYGTGAPCKDAPKIPAPPQWRTFESLTPPQEVPETPPVLGLAPVGQPEVQVPEAEIPDLEAQEEVRQSRVVQEMVSAAIALRRPLLVTGPPGCGKSILATLVAVELSFGPVLRWPITSSSRLDKALYDYDAIGRVHEDSRLGRRDGGSKLADSDSSIGKFIRLGPLGTALLPWTRPRVLLIDEIDKSDIDLPNELLDVFEQGEFRVPELERLSGDEPVQVMTADRGGMADIVGGVVRCHEFPVVIMTSNGERSFPPAFLRRCLRLKLEQPMGKRLESIVRSRIPSASDSRDLVTEFETLLRQDKKLATDQLLNAVFIAASRGLDGDERATLLRSLAQDLDQVSP